MKVWAVSGPGPAPHWWTVIVAATSEALAREIMRETLVAWHWGTASIERVERVRLDRSRPVFVFTGGCPPEIHVADAEPV